jgi:putative ABC transport system ATP-binding protein/macrolide transport system ATP-binding/permease protein/lipoprotein-releasing system ATP-binding protein
MLEARNLRKTYTAGLRPVAAVSDLSLDVAGGEFVAICGRSGSGKSTLLGMLGGICRPTSGTVQLDGVNLWSLSSDRLADFRNRHVGFVFQFASLLASLRTIDNVALPALIARRDHAEDAFLRAEKLLVRVSLGDRFESYPGELSGGQQRRVALARALINEPRLILADEPTGDLDEECEAETFRLLLELRRERGCTLIVVTHNPNLAHQADRVIHVRNGRVVSSTVPKHVPTELPVERASKPGLEATARPDSTLAGADSRRALGGLGAAFRRSLTGVAVWTAVIAVAALIINYGTALYQRSRVAHSREAKQQLVTVSHRTFPAPLSIPQLLGCIMRAGTRLPVGQTQPRSAGSESADQRRWKQGCQADTSPGLTNRTLLDRLNLVPVLTPDPDAVSRALPSIKPVLWPSQQQNSVAPTALNSGLITPIPWLEHSPNLLGLRCPWTNPAPRPASRCPAPARQNGMQNGGDPLPNQTNYQARCQAMVNAPFQGISQPIKNGADIFTRQIPLHLTLREAVFEGRRSW